MTKILLSQNIMTIGLKDRKTCSYMGPWKP